MAQRPLIGTSLDQISTNGMLGDLAFQDSSGAYIDVLRGSTSLEKLSKELTDTAVDIFVYDTRKDSDGGNWRKRTQHTSWYNETLNTATRGSRRDFPSVAVIVATTSSVTIYDGDDPDMPMWMVFEVNTDSSDLFINDSSSALTSISALNGRIFAGSVRTGTTGNVTGIDFIGDRGGMVYTSSSDIRTYNGGIGQRNDGLGNSAGTSNWFTAVPIVNRNVNDVAMTVLPNAPIDSATGLPVPTIAVATDGGVSVIRDNGTVVNIAEVSSAWSVNLVKIYNSRLISNGTLSGANSEDYYIVSNIPNSNTNYLAGGVNFNHASVPKVVYSRTHDVTSTVAMSENDFALAHVDTINHLTQIQYTESNQASSLVNFITSSYNTGWMHGDIKGAFLSDTSTASVTGTELVTNGTFDSNVTGWTVSIGNGVISRQTNIFPNGAIQLVVSDGIYTAVYNSTTINVTPGQKYVVSWSHYATVGGTARVIVWDGNTTTRLIEQYQNSSNNTVTYKFTIIPSESFIRFIFDTPGAANGTQQLDNISVRLTEEDRSVNANPLQVFGTITKSPVATGAELVAYSGFSNSTNYLRQPFNSDLAIGNNDFSCVGWFKKSTSSNTGMIIYGTDGLTQVFDIRVHTDMKLLAQITENAFTTREIVSAQGPTLNDNFWHQFHVVRRSNILYAYLDGNLLGTSALVQANITNPLSIVIGGEGLTASLKAFEGSLSLIRFSKSAPSPEQIKKIYEDEKALFQPNSQCTLYGSSDAVTALAYDDTTRLLSVGTSSGRSDFQGLERINNTTTAVTTAISASNGLIAEQ
jgi:hypothetical protein